MESHRIRPSQSLNPNESKGFTGGIRSRQSQRITSNLLKSNRITWNHIELQQITPKDVKSNGIASIRSKSDGFTHRVKCNHTHSERIKPSDWLITPSYSLYLLPQSRRNSRKTNKVKLDCRAMFPWKSITSKDIQTVFCW